jgi:hypothetical protein
MYQLAKDSVTLQLTEVDVASRCGIGKYHRATDYNLRSARLY